MKHTFKLFTFVLLLVTFFGCETNEYGAYGTWDADANELIERDEFDNTFTEVDYYSAWDTDGDGLIDETEWDTGVTTYYPAYDPAVHGDYGAWDLDDDTMLDSDEFVTGTYSLWDTDGDGNIEVVEYEEWYHDV